MQVGYTQYLVAGGALALIRLAQLPCGVLSLGRRTHHVRLDVVQHGTLRTPQATRQ